MPINVCPFMHIQLKQKIEILLRLHYSKYDNSTKRFAMHRLYLDTSNNVNGSSITMSSNHFIYILPRGTNSNCENNLKFKQPVLIPASQVKVGDLVYYYNYNGRNGSDEKLQVCRVLKIDDSIEDYARIAFTKSKYMLVDNIIASPYVGPLPIFASIEHMMVPFLAYIQKHTNCELMVSFMSHLAYFVCCTAYHMLGYVYNLKIKC